MIVIVKTNLFTHSTTNLTKTVNVTASNEPRIVEQVERLNHQEGTNATFTCSIGSGDLSSLTFDWFKDEKRLIFARIDASKFRIMTQPDNFQSLLRVIDLNQNDSGVYSCVAKNKYGQDKISTKLTVKGR